MDDSISEDTVVEDAIYSCFKESVTCPICSINVHELPKCLLQKMY